MDNKQRLQHSYISFVLENFSDLNAAWRKDLRAAFMELSLTPEQIERLLNPINATQQFRAEFARALTDIKQPKSPQLTLSAAFSEPVNKIATYMISSSNLGDMEARDQALKKAALILPTLGRNLDILLGANAPQQCREIYAILAEFGKASVSLINDGREETLEISNVNDLEGMHAIMPLPAALKSYE